MAEAPATIDALLVAVPETAGSALYGIVDVLAAAGTLWSELVGEGPRPALIRPIIVSDRDAPFDCGHGIPVRPGRNVSTNPAAPIVIVPELWLGIDEEIDGRYPAILDWLRRRYKEGSSIYSACSGSVLLAASGLLDHCEATSHWGYADLFRTRYPKVRFRPEPNLAFADPAGRLVTAGGTSSWHDLALHIIARHCGPGEALRIAKVYLLKWHAEGQLPYASLVRRVPHADSAVRACEAWLERHFREPEPIGRAVEQAGMAERTLKRRFRAATGLSLTEYVQNLRIEEAKRQLEEAHSSFEEIAATVGYENAGFFRALFKKRTGMTPVNYRKMFQTIAAAGA
jgi:transcriptional regulator GlxA family with amidase domain